jgi:hypothetical protein
MVSQGRAKLFPSSNLEIEYIMHLKIPKMIVYCRLWEICIHSESWWREALLEWPNGQFPCVSRGVPPVGRLCRCLSGDLERASRLRLRLTIFLAGLKTNFMTSFAACAMPLPGYEGRVEGSDIRRRCFCFVFE